MLSRVAENIYWMARYLERAEGIARLVSVNTNLLLDLPAAIAPGWEKLIWISGTLETFRERIKDQECNERRALRFLVGDPQNPGSLLSSLGMVRENCRTIRDIVPRESWELINELYLRSKEDLQSGLTKRGRHEYLKRVVYGCQTVAGSMTGTMNHDQGYQFLRIGRFIERADMTTRIIDVRSADLLPADAPELGPFDNIQWMSVLKSLTAYQMYRRSMQTSVRRPDVLRFLFLSQHFPRSVFYCLGEVEVSASALGHHEEALRIVGRLKRVLQEADVATLSQDALHQFVDEMQLGLTDLHDAVQREYFLAAPEDRAAVTN